MIEYTIRTSARARNVRLSVSQHSGVVVVVPLGFETSRVPAIIAQKEEWIRRSIEKVQWGRPTPEIPVLVNLQSIGRITNVVIEHNSSRKNYFIEDNNSLRLFFDPRGKKIPFTLLRQWLHEKAIEILLPWLKRVGKEHGFTYNKAGIRLQRTRWGSCSAKKNINLNRTLVFLRPELVEYLMIHELCHTVEMNHSKKYWKLVEAHCQEYRALDKELKHGKELVERWVF